MTHRGTEDIGNLLSGVGLPYVCGLISNLGHSEHVAATLLSNSTIKIRHGRLQEECI